MTSAAKVPSAGGRLQSCDVHRGAQRAWIGLATVGDKESGGPLLVGMFVDSAARQLGVGAALIEAVSAWAQGRSGPPHPLGCFWK
jgi:GNAT superfamily N-acetyltransferase